jgi:hypothetical protein
MNRLFGLALIVVGCGVAYWLVYSDPSGVRGTSAGSPAPEPPPVGLTVAHPFLNLGEVWEEDGFTYQLPIQNQTRSAIQIHDFAVSCGCCRSVEPRSLLIPAGETRAVLLKLDLTHRTDREVGLSRRRFAFNLTPVGGPGCPLGFGWEIQGVVKSRVTLDTSLLQFGDSAVHGQPPPFRKVVATSHVPAQWLDVTADPKVATVQVTRRKDDPRRFELTVAPHSGLKPGRFEFVVSVGVVTPAGKRLPGTSLPVVGEMQPEVRALPSRLFLPPTPVGQTAEATLVLQPSAGVPLEVDHIEVDSPDLAVVKTAVEGLPPGRAFRVTQKVTREGDSSSRIRFVLRRPGQGLSTVPVEVLYRGEPNRADAASTPEGKVP